MSRVVWSAEGSPSGSLTTWNDSTSRCPERSQPPVAGLVVLQRPAVMPSAMMPQSVGASRAKMRSDIRSCTARFSGRGQMRHSRALERQYVRL